MSCEKQFLPANNTFLYCSEACRLHDQAPTYTRSQSYSGYSSQSTTSHSPPQSPYTPYTPYTPYAPYARQFASTDDGPDIIPRFSPTISRPRSYFNSDPYPTQTLSASPPSHSHSQTHSVYTNSKSSTALASLRELATALPRVAASNGSESPPTSSISRTGSGVWNYMPFTSTTKSQQTPTITPGSSYTGYGNVSQSYNAYGGRTAGREDSTYGATAKSYGAYQGAGGYGNTGGMGMDRPLPPRNGPGGYGHRPRSIDLVTPFSGH